jgi:stearoyl-CoA desaturase (delta-9 desaturase)
VQAIPFATVHLVCFAAIWTGVDLTAVILCAVLYVLRMFAITAGYHRYFAHRAYRTSRAFRFFLAFLGCTAMQKGPLWWAANHRHHHKYSDTDQDPHSPVQRGFWWSHVGWVLADDYNETDWDAIKDWTKYPELVWLNRLWWVPPLLLSVGVWFVLGWSALIVGVFISTVLLYHGTFLVNSLCHVFGKRRYQTTDQSRNNWLVAFLTLGEGWHNNHHHYQSAACQGFFWWEIDFSYYALKGLEVFGVVWDVRRPPRRMLQENAK